MTEESSSSENKFEMVGGGYYFVPEGFDDITKETYALRYVQEWQNYDLDMYIMVTNTMQINIPIGVEEEYNQTVNSYGDSVTLSLDKWEGDGYILSGTDSDGQIFYHKVKTINSGDGDKYISIYITYPSANSDTCNKILEDFVFSFVYE